MERVSRRTNIPTRIYIYAMRIDISIIGIVRKWKFVLRDVFRLFRAKKKFFPDNCIYTYTVLYYYIVAAVLVVHTS